MLLNLSPVHRLGSGLLLLLVSCSGSESLTTLAPETSESPSSVSTIVGGEPTGPLNEYPFMVSLRRSGNSHFCGGTLFNERTILTAAHCIDFDGPDGPNFPLQPEDVSVAIGRYLRTSPAFQTVDVTEIISHPDFVGNTGFPFFNYDSDVAVMRLAEPQFSAPKVTLVSSSTLIAAGAPSVAIGWGTTSEGGVLALRLQEVEVPVVANSVCQMNYDDAPFPFSANSITPNMVCAGLPQGGQDACQGDSGGPLLGFNGNQLEQIGITSFGFGCARPDAPGVYTNVLEFVDWIEANAF